MSGERPTECEAFAAVVNAVLDGDAPAAALADGHPLTCRECRGLAAAARVLAAAGPVLRVSPTVPVGLAARLVVVRRRPKAWLPATAAGLAIAVGVWVSSVGWAESSRPTSASVAPDVGLEDSAHPTKSPRMSDQLAAVAGIARSASERAAAPARLLAPTSIPAAPARPPADVFAALGQASKSAADPVAGTTRRAVGLFLRDFGLSAKPAG